MVTQVSVVTRVTVVTVVTLGMGKSCMGLWSYSVTGTPMLQMLPAYQLLPPLPVLPQIDKVIQNPLTTSEAKGNGQ